MTGAAMNIIQPRPVSGARTIKRTLLGAAAVLISAIFTATLAAAQQVDEEKGIDQGNYNIKQSVEFGGRFTNVSGDEQTYNTFVNLQQGPRLLNFTTEMHSLDPHGSLFDRFYFSNFGYGGDPNVVSSVRISKNKWYSFSAMVRHDQNFWDYSLLANPFNPATPVGNAPPNFNPIINAPSNVLGTTIVAISPHYFNIRRNLQNYGITLLPDAKLRFRLGYNHNTNNGPSYSAIHQGTEQFLLQNVSSTMNQYRLGVDFRFLPRTNVSYDQIWSYYKTDPGQFDPNQQFSVGTGFPPVDLGVSWNPPSQPCNPTFQPGGLVNPKCSAYYNYNYHQRSRLNAPTEQISIESNFISSLQLSGKFSYTGGDLNNSSTQLGFNGLESRSSLAAYTQGGPLQGRQVSSYADFGATWQITKDFSLVDSFHYGNWREPAQFSASECSFFSNSLIVAPNVFASTATLPVSTCTAPANGVAGIPTHSTSSGPDVLLNVDANFLKQQITSNLIEGQIQISPKAGAYFGYRYTHRVIADNFFNLQNAIYYPNNAARGNCALLAGVLPDGCTQNTDGSISYTTPDATYGPPGVTNINSNTAVLGLWAKPVKNLTLNLDAEIGTADNTFTRLSPQNSQQVRARAQYRAKSWLNLSAFFLTTEGQNNLIAVNGDQHNRATGFSASVTPTEKLSAQIGYNYNNIYSNLYLCFTSSAAAPGLPACPGVTGLVQENLNYSSIVNTGFLDFLWTPLKRVTLEVGANLSGVSGSEVNLNPLSPMATAPLGPLNSTWYQPYGSVAYHFAKHWTGRARWDYYGYHEDLNGSYQDLYATRNFHANLITLSVRYGF
jgi:hypothetical protein